jgi:putative ABC transport system permease protein
MENQKTDPRILALMRPYDPDYSSDSRHPVAVIARLKPGVDIATAQAELLRVQTAIDAQHPDMPKNFGVFLTNLQMNNARFIRTSLITLMTAVALLLVIACANVAGLLLRRATRRQCQIAQRAALGSGRRRVAAQLLTGSLVLAFLGAGLGVLFAYGGVKGFSAVVRQVARQSSHATRKISSQS